MMRWKTVAWRHCLIACLVVGLAASALAQNKDQGAVTKGPDVVAKDTAAKEVAAKERGRPPSPSDDTAKYAGAGKVLFTAFALALFLESALAALFNWRPFIQTFVRGTRTIVTFTVALVVVFWSPELRLFDSLVKALYPEVEGSFGVLGIVLSAMILAGGSAGINNLLIALGFRSQRTPESITPKPAPTMAWVAVRVTDPHSKTDPEPLLVLMQTNNSGVWAVIGSIKDRSRGRHYFTADKGRFPTSGGYAVKGGDTYAFKLASAADGKDRGTPAQWLPQVIAAGAIVDIEFQD